MTAMDQGRMTARAFLDMPADPPRIRRELANGEIVVSPSPVPDHSYLDRTLGEIIGAHVRTRGLGQLFGDVDTILGPRDVRRPDLLYFAKHRLHLIGKKAIHGPPDLCVEIVSPSSEHTDRNDKFLAYATFGVENYWIIDPEPRTAEAYVLKTARINFPPAAKMTTAWNFPLCGAYHPPGRTLAAAIARWGFQLGGMWQTR